MPNLGEVFPDFEAVSTHGTIKFHDWLGDSWGILFSHPADYTAVCTTELAMIIGLMTEFKKRGVKPIALSCGDLESHKEWTKDIEFYNVGGKIQYPIIADNNRDLAVKLGMVEQGENDKLGLPLTCRTVFIIGPDKKLKLSMLYPITTGINYDEILRVIDSLKLTYEKKVATPANWKLGGECIVLPTVSKDDAARLFPQHLVVGLPSGKEYLRLTPQP